MAFAIQLDAFNFDDNEAPTEDPLLAGLLMMPIEAQIHEVSLSLLRHHISKSKGSNNALLEVFERVYPRTASSITNKKVLWRLLGIDAKSGVYNDSVSVLENLAESQLAASAVVVQFLRRKCEDSQLTAAVSTALGLQNPPSDADLAKTLSLDLSNSRTFLEMIVEYNLTLGAQMGHGGPTTKAYEFDHLRNEIEVNGQRIGVTSTLPALVSKLSDIDLTNAIVLGKGAGGSVLKALHIPTQQYMAVKTIQLDDKVMGQVVSELSIVWGLGNESAAHGKSPFLINSHGVFYNQGVLYIVMEVMDGSLNDLVHNKQGLPEKVCRALAFQALSGLQFMHGTLRQLHRDIKPHNILFRKADGAVKLSDFGISSTQLETLNLNRKSTFCGTLRYMSPLCVEETDYGFEADLWSFGISIVQLALGDLPFKADNPYMILALRNTPPRLPDDGRFSAEFMGFIADVCDPTGNPPLASQLLMHPWLRGYTVEESRRVIASL